MTGSLHLIGGGWGGDGGAWSGFRSAAAARAGGRVPRIAIVAVRDGDHEEHAGKLAQALGAAGDLEPLPLLCDVGGELAELPDDVDGVLVGGGLVPAYLDAVAPQAARLRELVDDGVPYGGFSAGSAIAAARSLVGGWLVGGRPVVGEDAAQGLDALTVRDGLGLLPVAVDVHAAQWGTLGRLIAAVDTGAVDRGVAIDEDTALVVVDGEEHVQGTGHVWWVEPDDDRVVVRRQAADDAPRRPRPLRSAR